MTLPPGPVPKDLEASDFFDFQVPKHRNPWKNRALRAPWRWSGTI